MWSVFYIFILFASVSSDSSPQLAQWGSSIDALMQRLQRDSWEREEAPCLQHTLTLLHNVKNHTLWASWIWNANTVPTGNLFGSLTNFGNFDQCLKPPWLRTHPHFRTKYCVARLTLTEHKKTVPEYDPYGSVEEYLNSPTPSGLPSNELVWGVCVPASCGARGAARLGAAMCDVTACAPRAPSVTVDHCQTAGENTPYTAGFYVFITILVLAIVTAVVSTCYRMQTPSDDETSVCLDNDHCLQTIITESFDIRRNYADLVKENKHEIRILNGIRFIVATAVIAIHELFYALMLGFVNTRDFNMVIEGPTGLLLHADVVVDTFFAMSGLLYIKGLLANSYKNQNLFVVLWKRYVRLIGAFSVVIFYLCSVSDFTGSGPHWPQFSQFEPEVCRRTWRKSLLMLSTRVDDMCDLVTWYIPCDYQLGILATVLFYFYKKDRRLGLAAFGTSAVLSLIIPGVLTYWYRLPVVHFANVGKWYLTYRDYWEVSYTYMASYSRGGAYLVGVAMGYLMTLYKPDDYRKTVSQFWSIVGVAVSLSSMVCVFSLGWYYLLKDYEPLEAAVVAATNRVVWATAICCIIGLCEYGTVPFIPDLLSLPIFTPLSRLSYGIYMIHPLLIQRRIFAKRGPMTFDGLAMVTDTFGDLTLATGLSFAMWLFIEAPFINLCNHLLFNKAKSIPSDVMENTNREVKAKLL
ncbi:hypothetical protein B5X24_HaOG208301 [Helicoverpa armigera]|nr:hypothetical protein B5X24_HaOG208301 [Helicoverpa armigera]